MMGDEQAERYVTVARSLNHVAEELHLLAIPYFQSEKFLISDNLTVALPKSVIRVLKVAVLDSHARLWLLGQDKNLRRVKANEDAAPVTCPPTEAGTATSDDAVVFHNVITGGSLGEQYGLVERAFTSGSWRHDPLTNILEFGSGLFVTAGNGILVEYKTDFGEDKHRLIPKEWFHAIYYRVLQMLTAAKQPGASQVNFQQFVREYQTVLRASQNVSIEEWEKEVREARYAAPKWK
jgi:hypothetical protein